LVAAALSLNVAPAFRGGGQLDAWRATVLGASLVLAVWSSVRGRGSRLGLGPAMALMCVAWIVCGVLRLAGIPGVLQRSSSLLPLLAGLAVLVPGLPRPDRPSSRFRLGVSLAAATALLAMPLTPRGPLGSRRRPRPLLPAVVRWC